MLSWTIVAGWYLVASVAAAVVFALDKLAAKNGSRRFSERALHLMELAGGWPGALAAMHVFRHKRAKASFYLVSWLIAAVHIAAWSVAVWRGWIG